MNIATQLDARMANLNAPRVAVRKWAQGNQTTFLDVHCGKIKKECQEKAVYQFGNRTFGKPTQKQLQMTPTVAAQTPRRRDEAKRFGTLGSKRYPSRVPRWDEELIRHNIKLNT